MAPQLLYAGGGSPLTDSDQDLLPDLCEWVTLSRPDMADSDQDGTSDFAEVLDYSSPLTRGPRLPATYAVRLIMHTAYEGQASERIWLHVLMRLPSGHLSDIKGFGLFVDQLRTRLPLSSLLATSFRELKVASVKGQGLLVRMSFRLPLDLNSSSVTKAPAVFSCYAKLGQSFQSSGSVILPMSGLYYTLAAETGRRILQTTNAASSSHPFWSASSTCVMQLEVHGVGTGGVLCEIKKARCETAQYLRCASGCAQSEGMTFFVPDGLGLICGG